ncbi:riboflavin synthase [Amycolatopsis arida]|uniref:Riboflavin synthase n=1 Tax=Amycolatopsis arida TaxID=587909 RepID=A0A1I5Z327_9PSEU|nr:riboflavin synthase [Amycolatopsis arida]TDX90089.1 riboflavin synthase [Amycolatopsis arida]SFQ50873.1 riboflavin synthase [Amycolatopsis arida]
MFTGIVEEIGEITAVEQVPNAARMTIRGPVVTTDARHGDSICVSGVCLTVVDVSGSDFSVDVVHETMTRSSLAKLRVGDLVNLERATPVGGRFGGHVVQGHVDGTGVFLSRDPQGLTRFALPPALARYVVEKGSIAVDGVSLTVAGVTEEEFAVALIPTTMELTTLGRRDPGDLVNLEVDVLAKYVEKLAAPHLGAAAGDNGAGKEVGRE